MTRTELPSPTEWAVVHEPVGFRVETLAKTRAREITPEPITAEMVLEHDKPSPIRRQYIADWNRALALDPHAVVRPFVMAQREGMDDEILSWATSPPPF
jgi:hypothetical protein